MEFGDDPQQKKIPWKLIALIGGGVVIGTIIVVFTMRGSGLESGISSNNGDLLQKKENVGLRLESERTAQSLQTKEVFCEKASDKETCGAFYTALQAKEQKDPSLCKSLKDANKDSCLWDVAFAKSDETICKNISDTEFNTACVSGVLYNKATLASEIGLCDKIPDESTKVGCRDYILGPITSENCASRGKEKSFCEQVAKDERENITQTAAPTSDPDLDSDGLTSEDEITKYKTDPNNADTDGDGYLDGQEVSSGHDPLKK